MPFEIHLEEGLVFYGVVLLRLFAAVFCGAMIGFERKRNYKTAGLRTHILVSVGAALIMIISKYAFSDLVGDSGGYLFGTNATDPARIAAQIVSGMGFIGAGVIFKNGGSIKGITTAAGLWATAGVGMAIGSGMIIIGAAAAVIIVLIQWIMHKRTFGSASFATINIEIAVQGEDHAAAIIEELVKASHGTVISNSILRKKPNEKEYKVSLRVPENYQMNKFREQMEKHEEIVRVEYFK